MQKHRYITRFSMIIGLLITSKTNYSGDYTQLAVLENKNEIMGRQEEIHDFQIFIMPNGEPAIGILECLSAAYEQQSNKSRQEIVDGQSSEPVEEVPYTLLSRQSGCKIEKYIMGVSCGAMMGLLGIVAVISRLH